MSWKRFLVPLAGFAAVIGGGYGWSWAGHALVGPSRSTEQAVVYWAFVVQLFLAGLAFIVVASAREFWGTSAASGALGNLRRGRRAVILSLGALAVVLSAVRAVPLGGGSAPAGHWWALAASSSALVTLMVLLVVALLGLRKDARSNGSAATRSP